jgi:hypothetical protein
VRARILLGGLVAWFALAAGLIVLLACLRPLGASGPAQPIAFSHAIHVGKVGLECTHCHTTVGSSSFPGMPSVSICMACHENAAIDRPEVKKLRAYWAEKRPIEWVKVHELPWHVGFTHKRHVRAGVDCAECHGEVKTESRIRQVRSLTMGWCITCHRARGAPRDCWTCHR